MIKFLRMIKILLFLKNNTENIIEYIGEKNNENEKEFKFWELLKKISKRRSFICGVKS